MKKRIVLTALLGILFLLFPCIKGNCAGYSSTLTSSYDGYDVVLQASIPKAQMYSETYTFQWQISTNRGLTFRNIDGADDITYRTSLAGLTADTRFRCRVNISAKAGYYMIDDLQMAILHRHVRAVVGQDYWMEAVVNHTLKSADNPWIADAARMGMSVDNEAAALVLAHLYSEEYLSKFRYTPGSGDFGTYVTDPVEGTANTVRQMIHDLYRFLLGRAPESSALEFWAQSFYTLGEDVRTMNGSYPFYKGMVVVANGIASSEECRRYLAGRYQSQNGDFIYTKATYDTITFLDSCYTGAFAVPVYQVNVSKGTGIATVTASMTASPGTRVTVQALPEAGYAFRNWTGTYPSVNFKFTFTMPFQNVSLTANAEKMQAQYQVFHYLQNVNGSGYTLSAADTQTFRGDLEATVRPAVKNFTGFTSPATQTVVITADGKASVSYYYTRNRYTLTLNRGTGIASVSGGGSIYYGAGVTVTASPVSGYEFVGWSGSLSSASRSFSFTMPASALTLTANASENRIVTGPLSVTAADASESGAVYPGSANTWYVKSGTALKLSYAATAFPALSGGSFQPRLFTFRVGSTKGESSTYFGQSAPENGTQLTPLSRGTAVWTAGQAALLRETLSAGERKGTITQTVTFTGNRSLWIYPSAAGYNSYGGEKWSAYAADEANGIFLRVDDSAPEILISLDGGTPVPFESFQGTQLTPDNLIDRRADGRVKVTVSAQDPSAGISSLVLRVINTDTGEIASFPAVGGQVSLQLKLSHDLVNPSFDNGLFNGNFYLEASATDRVGNLITARTLPATEFDITCKALRLLDEVDHANDERIAAGLSPVFQRGESGLITSSVWGYADWVEISFGEEEFADLNVIYLFSGSLPAADAARGVSVIRRDENDFRNVCEVTFMIPLDYERDAVTVRVDAHKNNQTVSWEERLLLSVEGTVLDELYTALH
ncbi:MAG: hypothetical protein IKS07_03330 [Lachnospiraceae bacterium]|nr:hypothetical protein [Lachnospiraceae bacterium]